jgi:hypothetical protein
MLKEEKFFFNLKLYKINISVKAVTETILQSVTFAFVNSFPNCSAKVVKNVGICKFLALKDVNDSNNFYTNSFLYNRIV